MVEPTLDSRIYSEQFSKNLAAVTLTRNAKIYGERGRGVVLIPAGKSGLTPTSPTLGSIPESRDEYDAQEGINQYQLWHWFGFSSQDLTDILAAEKPYAQLSTLWDTTTWDTLAPFDPWSRKPSADAGDDIGIMPLLHRTNWTEISMGSGPLDVDADNDDVWEAMKPALQLATRIMNDLHTNSYYDTLFHGEWRDIDPARIPSWFVYHASSPGPLQSLWPRALHERTAKSIKQDWEDFTDEVTFFIDPDLLQGRPIDGSTYYAGDDVKTLISISPNAVIPLLSSQMTPSERLRGGFFLATTILHEIAHALIMHKLGGMFNQEPYYQDEPVAEIGYSLENAVWGGLPVRWGPQKDRDSPVQNEFQPPKFWLGREDFPSRFMYRHYNTGQTELDLDKLVPGHYEVNWHPLRTDFIEDIQNRDFWNVLVTKFGNDVLKDSYPVSSQILSADNETPFKIVKSANFNANEVAMNELFMPSSVEPIPRLARRLLQSSMSPASDDTYGKFRAQRMRISYAIISKLRQRKRDAFLAWRKWGNPQKPPLSFGTLPKYYSLHIDQVVELVAASMGLTTLQLRTRGRRFVENTVSDWLESKQIPRDHFDFAVQDVLLTKLDIERGIVPTDLDEIYESILEEGRSEGMDIDRDIIAPLKISQEGGDLSGMNNLEAAVRRWLQHHNHNPNRLDQEMIRRKTDFHDPLKTFYIRPLLEEVRAAADRMGRTAHRTAPTDFEKAESLRDFIEEVSSYPRDALDEQLGNVPRDPGDIVVLRRRFVDDLLRTMNIEPSEPQAREVVMRAQFRVALLEFSRPWLLRNGYSTKLDLGLGSG